MLGLSPFQDKRGREFVLTEMVLKPGVGLSSDLQAKLEEFFSRSKEEGIVRGGKLVFVSGEGNNSRYRGIIGSFEVRRESLAGISFYNQEVYLIFQPNGQELIFVPLSATLSPSEEGIEEVIFPSFPPWCCYGTGAAALLFALVMVGLDKWEKWKQRRR